MRISIQKGRLPRLTGRGINKPVLGKGSGKPRSRRKKLTSKNNVIR